MSLSTGNLRLKSSLLQFLGLIRRQNYLHINANPYVQIITLFCKCPSGREALRARSPIKIVFTNYVCTVHSSKPSWSAVPTVNDSPALMSMCATNACTCYNTVGYSIDSCVHGVHDCTCVRVHVCVCACLCGWVGARTFLRC